MSDTEVQAPVDPNADLREELDARRAKLAEVKAAAQLSAKEQEDAAARASLQKELDAVNAEIQYEEQAAALIAKASGKEEPAARATPATQAPAQRTPAQQAPANAPVEDKGE